MRRRLFLSFLLIILVAVTGVAIIARQGAAREVRAFMFGGGMTGPAGLVTVLEEHYRIHGSWEGVQDLLVTSSSMHGMGQPGRQGYGPGGMMGEVMSQRLRVAEQDGLVVADSSGEAVGNQLTQAEIETALPLSVNGHIVGYLVTEGGMGYTPNDELFLLGRINRAALIAGLAAGALALVLALLLAYTLLRPVRELTIASRHLAQGDMSQRVSVRGSDELAELGRTFNQMADSLQRAEENRRAMTADIAHELRTPLSVQKANLEALQDGVYPLTSENLTSVIEQNHLLTRLVDDLRTLALADAGQLELEHIPTDISALVGRVVERFQAQASTQNIILDYLPPTTPFSLLPLDPVRIEQILTNLLSNALRYTPSGGTIAIALTTQAGAAEITIHDSGPGIASEALPQVFERFYRADRSRARLEGGSGLGLAIARQLARAHGGDLTAANHPQGGAVFSLRLPM